MKRLLIVVFLFSTLPGFGQLRYSPAINPWKPTPVRFIAPLQPGQPLFLVQRLEPVQRFSGQAPAAFFCRLEVLTERKLGIQLLFHAGDYFHDIGVSRW